MGYACLPQTNALVNKVNSRPCNDLKGVYHTVVVTIVYQCSNIEPMVLSCVRLIAWLHYQKGKAIPGRCVCAAVLGKVCVCAPQIMDDKCLILQNRLRLLTLAGSSKLLNSRQLTSTGQHAHQAQSSTKERG